jgi:hypothetical protein
LGPDLLAGRANRGGSTAERTKEEEVMSELAKPVSENPVDQMESLRLSFNRTLKTVAEQVKQAYSLRDDGEIERILKLLREGLQ